MAGGDSSSSMAVVAKEGEEDARLWKKQKQDQGQPAEEDEQRLNPPDRFSEWDPKQGEFVYIHYFYERNFDLDEESPLGPMRHTDKIFKEGFRLKNSVNVISVKIVSSDYGYPLNVYGTIIARDHLDRKCVYIFQRGKDNCQFISSEDDSLILTGPKRGFMVLDAIFFEIDLKVKDARGRQVKDERLSKGLLQVNGIMALSYERNKHEVETETLVSMHSTLDLSYTFVRNAVEGTVEIRILEGPIDFYGKIVACTTNFRYDIVLHDSKVNGILTAGDNGVVQTAQRIVAVSEDEILVLTVDPAAGGDELSIRTVEFTPRRNSYDEAKITCGSYKMLLKVTWSIICR